MMRAQISLEFMAAVAIYFAFILAMLQSQGAAVSSLRGNASEITQSFEADSVNAQFFLGGLYSSELAGAIEYRLPTGCRVIGGEIFCGGMSEPIRDSYSGVMNRTRAEILG